MTTIPRNDSRPLHLDAFLPAEMARRAEQVGVAKATMPAATTFVLAILAGAFIGLGAMFATVVTTGASDILPYGVTKLLGGFVFSLGLILVIIAGAELFTGNNLIVMAVVGGRVTYAQLLRNWFVVYAGNFVGSVATAGIVLVSGQPAFADESEGVTALDTPLDFAAHQHGVSLGAGAMLAMDASTSAPNCLAGCCVFSKWNRVGNARRAEKGPKRRER